MPDDHGAICRLRIYLAPGVGPSTARSLISCCGSPEEVFCNSLSSLLKVPGLREDAARNLLCEEQKGEAEMQWERIREQGLRMLFFSDGSFPYRLRQIHDFPLALFTKGAGDLNHPRMISVVGTRKATTYGRETVRDLIRGFASAGVTVVSGLAYGIDIESHRESLRCGMPTIAVLAHGLEHLYPSGHRKDADRILEQGALVSEYLPGQEAEKQFFPTRNRIIAGLADATVVVESSIKGGAMLTARLAFSYNREVFAIPGRRTDPSSAGCNVLIRDNVAALTETSTDILHAMNWSEGSGALQPGIQAELWSDLNPKEEEVIEAIREASDGLLIDQLVRKLSRPVPEISMTLLELEFKGILKTLPGPRYKLV